MAKKERIEQDAENDAARAGGNGLLTGLLVAGATIGAAALANAFIFYKTPPLTTKLPGGEVRYFPTAEGDVFYKKAGSGPPLLLVHGIGAGCSSYEWKQVWDELTKQYTVYALDLLGFGKSDKPAIAYSAETYVALLDDFCRRVIKVGEGRGECDVIATSLSAAYVVALSGRDPKLFRRLVLVCPTGIEELASKPGNRSEIGRTVLSAPVLGTTIYNAISSKSGIRNYMTTRLFAQASIVTDEMVDEYHTAAHQPGGENVLPSFLSGMLNICVSDEWKKIVDLPLLVWGEWPPALPDDYYYIRRRKVLDLQSRMESAKSPAERRQGGSRPLR
ncbi:MAG: alpha/beta fold hydrolase, partial [Armatimonadetes bacterium]|nr:alpha/beta fold hydrolase [Armatimonadota bacterium]